MSKKRQRRKKDHASLDKYGASLTTALAVGATVWAFFRLGFKIKDGVEKAKNGNKGKKK